MDNLKSLFDKKRYDLIIDLTKNSKNPEEILLRVTSFIMLNKDNDALDEIENNQTILDQHYPYKTMRLHFELLFKNKLFDEALIALDHYKNLPYISQEVEEFLRAIPQEISTLKNNKTNLKAIDEICSILENEEDNGLVSEALFSLNNYNFFLYADSLVTLLKKKNINSNLRSYALMILSENKYGIAVKYLNHDDKLITVVPSKIEAPFTDKFYVLASTKLQEKTSYNITLQQIANNLLNYLIIDLYPENIAKYSLEHLVEAIYLLACDYIKEEAKTCLEESYKLKEEIKEIIESTKPLNI